MQTHRGTMRPIIIAVLAILLLTGFLALRGFRMPLRSFTGTPKPLNAGMLELRTRLSGHVDNLAVTIGERNLEHYGALNAAAAYIEDSLRKSGYAPVSQAFICRGKQVRNLEAIIPGGALAGEHVIFGAHYDSVIGTPGANDNASGVAAVLEIARMLKDSSPDRTLHFVFFVNEEPPYFQTPEMGSFVYAAGLRKDRVNVTAMLSIETIGSYYDDSGTQKYPAGLGSLYPDVGNFIGFAGNLESRQLLQRSIAAFRSVAELPSEGTVAPSSVPGVGWSDQWAFWQHGCPAIMVTDTAPFRYPYYHSSQDTPDKIDWIRFTRAVEGLRQVAVCLASR